jgi:hypothetical protein
MSTIVLDAAKLRPDVVAALPLIFLSIDPSFAAAAAGTAVGAVVGRSLYSVLDQATMAEPDRRPNQLIVYCHCVCNLQAYS